VLEKLSGFEEFAPGGRGYLKTLRGLDLVETFQKAVVRGALGMGKDVVASHPTQKDETNQ
jgi:cytochrome b involved in lipid metabolism